MEGIIVKYFQDKGFGFIQSSLPKDCLFNENIVRGDCSVIEEGDLVEFEASFSEEKNSYEATIVNPLSKKIVSTEDISNYHDKLTGTIRNFNDERGFGFINDIKGTKDYFFHISSTIGTFTVGYNCVVIFNLIPSKKKPGSEEAINVSNISKTYLEYNLSFLNNINNEFAYDHAKCLIKLNYHDSTTGLLPQLKERLFQSANEEYKILFMADGIIGTFKFESLLDNINYLSIRSIQHIIKRIDRWLVKDVFEKLLNQLPPIISDDSYNKAKELLDIFDNGDQYNPLFNNSGTAEILFNKANSEYIIRMICDWLLGHINIMDKSSFIKHICSVEESILLKVINRNISEYQIYVINELNNRISNISNEEEYGRAGNLLKLNSGSYSTLTPELIHNIYLKSTDFYKNRFFQDWINDAIDQVNITYLQDNVMRLDDQTLKNLLNREPSAPKRVILAELVKRLGKISNDEEYTEASNYLRMNGYLPQELFNPELVNNIYLKATDFYQNKLFQDWIDGSLNPVSMTYLQDHVMQLDEQTLKYILERVQSGPKRVILVELANKLGQLSNKTTYKRAIGLCNFYKKIYRYSNVAEFGNIFFEKADDLFKFELWINNYSDITPTNYIVNNLAIFNDDELQTILAKEDIHVNKHIINFQLNKLNGIYDDNSYEKIKEFVTRHTNFYHSEYFQGLARLIYNHSIDLYKYRLWSEGLVQNLDLEIFIKYYSVKDRYGNLEDLKKFCNSSMNIQFEQLYTYLLSLNLVNIVRLCLIIVKAAEETLNSDEIDNLLNNITTNLSDFQKICFLDEILKSHVLCFKYGRYKGHCVARVYEQDEDYITWVINNQRSTLIEVGGTTDISYYRKVFIIAKAFSERFELIKDNISIKIISLSFDKQSSFVNWLINSLNSIVSLLEIIQSERVVFYNEIRFELLDHFYDYIMKPDTFLTASSIDGFSSTYEKYLCFFTEDQRNHIYQFLTNKLKQSYVSRIEELGRIDSDEKFSLTLELIEPLTKFMLPKEVVDDISNFVYTNSTTEYKMKLWVKEYSSIFDFKLYSNYFFTLSKEERKIFNKKARAILKDELDLSLLRKRVPWELEATSENGVQLFSATWQSIWFLNGAIKFCIEDNIFSKEFSWEYSDEKYNLLFNELSGKRLSQLKVYYRAPDIIKIEGLDNIYETIWKISILKEIEQNTSFQLKTEGENRVPRNLLLKSECIQFLNTLQTDDFKFLKILEKQFRTNQFGKREAIGFDLTFLYTVRIPDNKIVLAWESAEIEKSKATYLFITTDEDYNCTISKLISFLESSSLVRSSILSMEEAKRKEIGFIGRIEHDNFDFGRWKSKLFELVPELLSVC